MASHHFASALLIGVLVVVAATATADTMPHRKPGLWQITSTMQGGPMPSMTSKYCIDAATENALMHAGQSMARRNCESPVMHVSGNTAVINGTCKFGNMTSTSHTVITFSGADAYHGETHSHMSPAPQGMPPEMVTTMDARWMGPCSADMKPGDIVMGNGMRTHFNASMMHGSPEGRDH